MEPQGGPSHAWSQGHEAKLSLEAAMRVSGALSIRPRKLPEVRVVVDLVIRLRFYRSVDISLLNKLLTGAFTKLVGFHFELWSSVDNAQWIHHQERLHVGQGALVTTYLQIVGYILVLYHTNPTPE